jgi:hypothetical protein
MDPGDLGIDLGGRLHIVVRILQAVFHLDLEHLAF